MDGEDPEEIWNSPEVGGLPPEHNTNRIPAREGEKVAALGYWHRKFYYYSTSTKQVAAFTAPEHTRAHLCSIAAPRYWENAYSIHMSDGGGLSWPSVASDLMDECRAAGPYDPERVRGRGAWWDHDLGVTVHLGHSLVVDNKTTPLVLPGSKYVYEVAFPLISGNELPDPLSNREAYRLEQICRMLRWEQKHAARLFAGWMVLAPVCGALNWRPSVWLTGGAGAGKAQPHSSNVLTEYGWKKMGDIKQGDILKCPDGGTGKVIGMFPQGKQKIFKFTFSDGRTARATDDHLWKVRLKENWKLMTTAEIRAIPPGHRKSRLAIPVSKPVELVRDKFVLPLHPYALGVLLGDGFLGNIEGHPHAQRISITSGDPEIFARVRSVLPANLDLFPTNCKIEMRLGDLSRYGSAAREMIKGLRLLGTRSATKFIPEPYLHASISDRIELLKGLMDTDGTIGKRGSVAFCSVSQKLAKDVQYLVRSLGGTALIAEKDAFYLKDGIRKKCATAFIVNIRFPDASIAFSLTRKLDRVLKDYQYQDSFYLGISSIDEDGEEDASCVMIDHPDRLYITDDFVVTHNTWIADHVIRPVLGKRSIYVALSTTEPSLRRMLRADALPVVFDEADRDQTGAAERIQSLLGLLRQASAETDAVVGKASPDGGVELFRARSMFCFQSINTSLSSQADISRVETLSLRDHKSPDDPPFEDLSSAATEYLTDEFGERLFARTVTLIPQIRHNAAIFSKAISALPEKTQRQADQIGALLAGAYSLHSTRFLSVAEATEFVMQDPWLAEQTPAQETRDEYQLLAHLMAGHVRVNNIETQIARLVEYASVDDPAQKISGGEARAALSDTGMKVIYHENELGVAVSTSHPALKKMLRGTPWAASWARALTRIKGVVGSDVIPPQRYGAGLKTRAVWIPTRVLLG